MPKSDWFAYFLAVLAGLAAGTLEVRLGDLLVTAIFVTISTMVLGFIRPQRAWRWTLIVAVFIPILRILTYFLLNERPYRAQVWESGLGFLTGIAGSYSGAMGRKGVDELFRSR